MLVTITDIDFCVEPEDIEDIEKFANSIDAEIKNIKEELKSDWVGIQLAIDPEEDIANVVSNRSGWLVNSINFVINELL